MTDWVTGSAILDLVEKGSPSPGDSDWADIVAAAVSAAIDARLDGTVPTTPQTAELTRSALVDGAAGYQERRAPHGVLSVGPDGDVTRLGAELLRSSELVLHRIMVPGIG